MKNKILDILKGTLMGLDSTIPGFSMGTLAVLLNIYERMIDAFSIVLKHPFKALKDMWALLLGFLIGLLLNILTISYLLSHFPLQTVMFFVGLVIVSIPITYKNQIHEKLKIRDFIAFFLSIGILVGLSLLTQGEVKEVSIAPVFLIMMVLVGAIGSGTMIIPGVSGSLIILALGYYNAVMDILKNILLIFKASEIDGYIKYPISLLCFSIGLVLGIVFVSKLLKILFKKYPVTVYSSILGLLFGSPFAIIYLTLSNEEYSQAINFSSPWLYIVSSLTLILGGLFGIFVSKFDKVKDKNKEVEVETIENAREE